MRKVKLLAVAVFVILLSCQIIWAFELEEIFGFKPYTGKDFPSDKHISACMMFGSYKFLQSLGKVKTGENEYILIGLITGGQGPKIIDLSVKQLDTKLWVYQLKGAYFPFIDIK